MATTKNGPTAKPPLASHFVTKKRGRGRQVPQEGIPNTHLRRIVKEDANMPAAIRNVLSPPTQAPVCPLASHFVTKKRGRGKDAPSFVTLRDTRPDWLQAAVYAAHCGDLPNDWIYGECLAACEAIDAGDLGGGRYPEDTLHEYADGRVDIYTRDLYQWAADFCLSTTFAGAESSAADMGEADGRDMVDRIRVLQYLAIENIARTMLDAADRSGET